MPRAVIACVLAAAALCAPAARAQDVPAPPAPGAPAAPEKAGRRFEMPGKLSVRAGETTESPAGNEVRFSGYVEIDTGDAHIKADTVIYRRDEGTVEALGNVVLAVPGAVLSGSRLLYRIEPETGEIDDVVGYIDQDNAILRAKKVERTGPDRLRIEQGVFTTCSQPTPYWSFRLGSGEFHLGHYAYLHNVQFRARQLPLFWSPYLVWPIKTGRAAGLLFPDFRTSTRLGTSVGIPYYWPFAKNADLTLKADVYSKVGVGINTQLDWLPTWSGWAKGNLYWINDQVRRKNRYLLTWNESQRFWNDFLLTANVEQVSDFDYFTDYETNLLRAATPQTNSTVDVSRSWSWYSLSFRARRWQLYQVGSTGFESTLLGERINNVLPEVEFRGRSQQLWKTPVYLSFRSSLDGFERRVLRAPADQPIGVIQESDLETKSHGRWGRADLSPQLQMPLIKQPWGDLTLTAGWQGTYYTGRAKVVDVVQPDGTIQKQSFPDEIVSSSMFRSLWNAGFQFSGPRFQRVFLTPHWGYTPKLKHVIEPFVSYSWRPSAGVDPLEVPQYDEVDAVPGQVSDLSYGIRQRFFALRKPEVGRSSGLASARETSFIGLEKQQKEQKQAEQKAEGQQAVEEKLDVEQNYNPVEIGSIEISQDRSFIRGLSTTYVIDPVTGEITNQISRFYSPVRMRFRFNPKSDQAYDASLSFDPANKTLTETSVSALTRLSDLAYVQARWYRRTPSVRPLGEIQSSLGTKWGYVTPNRRFSLENELQWDASKKELLNQHWEFRWATQCCSFRFSYDRRSFIGNFRREFALVVDLFGIGEVINLQTAK